METDRMNMRKLIGFFNEDDFHPEYESGGIYRYLIRDPERGLYKVGMSKCPVKRFERLNVRLGGNLELEAVMPGSDFRIKHYGMKLQKHPIPHSGDGEWFVEEPQTVEILHALFSGEEISPIMPGCLSISIPRHQIDRIRHTADSESKSISAKALELIKLGMRYQNETE